MNSTYCRAFSEFLQHPASPSCPHLIKDDPVRICNLLDCLVDNAVRLDLVDVLLRVLCIHQSDHRVNVQLVCKLGLQVEGLDDRSGVCQTCKKQPWVMIQGRCSKVEDYESDHRINVELVCELGLQVEALNDRGRVCQTCNKQPTWVNT